MNINTLIKKLQSYEKKGIKQVFFQDYCWNNLDVEFQQLSENQLCMVISEDIMEEGGPLK
jgi:hypothetical protein